MKLANTKFNQISTQVTKEGDTSATSTNTNERCHTGRRNFHDQNFKITMKGETFMM